MASPTLWQLSDAVSKQVAAATGLRSAPEITGSINPPFLLVGVPPIPDYRATFTRGKVLIEGWPLYILTSAKVDWVGQKALSEYADWKGARSVVTALENDKTLGGIAVDLQCNSFRPLGLDEVGIIGYYGGELRITVEVSGQ